VPQSRRFGWMTAVIVTSMIRWGPIRILAGGA
jgi:hypothetical protein